MGTRVFGVYIPSHGETDWLDQNELNDSLKLLARRTQNLTDDGTHGDAAHGPDYVDAGELQATLSNYAKQTDLRPPPVYSLAAEGSATLTQGRGAVDTGVTTDTDQYTVNINPGGADIAMSLDGGGSRYVIHFVENTTTTNNPTVGWQLIRSEL